MHRESRDDIETQSHAPQNSAFTKSFAIRPNGSERWDEQREHASDTRLQMKNEPHGEPDMRRHKGCEAENQDGRNNEVLAGHARERSAQCIDMLPLR